METIHQLNGLDWAIAVAVLLGVVLGYTRGLISQLISIASLFIAYVVAIKWYGDFAPAIGRMVTMPSAAASPNLDFVVKGLNLDVYMTNAIAFAILFFGTKIAFAVIGKVLHVFTSLPGIKSINKTAGSALGLIEAIVLVVVAVNVMTIIPNEQIQQFLKRSTMAPYVINEAPVIAGKLHEMWQTRQAHEKTT
ncbi:CvpA family protein [Paenibacillus thalictri]|uniref:CvpA family protein n=1 Tax=Paenibacillus thalictri TaxID=2527873 RepID=A0A4Q9DGP2_9BACL|nr:CvpA family protein [Paenibacillus thalictri]TBL71414.1 CvpA family protein [Paenibacillus thalictri]